MSSRDYSVPYLLTLFNFLHSSYLASLKYCADVIDQAGLSSRLTLIADKQILPKKEDYVRTWKVDRPNLKIRPQVFYNDKISAHRCLNGSLRPQWRHPA